MPARKVGKNCELRTLEAVVPSLHRSLSVTRAVLLRLVLVVVAVNPCLLFGLRLLVGGVTGVGLGEEDPRLGSLAAGILLSGIGIFVLSLLRRPTAHPSAVQAVIAVGVAGLVPQVLGRYSDGVAGMLLPIAVLVALLPARRALVDLSRTAVVPLALALLTTAVLAVHAVPLARQISTLHGEAAEQHYDASWMLLCVGLVCAASALRADGWQVTAVLGSTATALIGLMALAEPGSTAAVGRPVGVLVLGLAVAFAATALRPARRAALAAA